MRELSGWKCSSCGAVALAYRKRRPERCPACSGALADNPTAVLRSERADFPVRPKDDPDQLSLPFPAPCGGLF